MCLLLFVPGLLHSEVLPKDAVLETWNDFSGGLNTRDPAHKLANGFSPYLRNVDIEDGELTTVNGFTQLGSTPTLAKVNSFFQYTKPDGTSEFLVSDSSTLLKTQDFQTFAVVRAGLNNAFKLGCIQVEDKAWCSNGTDSVFTYDGSTTVVLDGDNYNIGKVPNVPKFKYLAYWQNRVWGFNIPSNSAYLGYSAIKSTDPVPVLISPDNLNAWANSLNFINVDKGDGTVGTFLKVFQGQLYAGKERGISAILGNDDVNYADVKVVKDYGFDSNDSVVELDNLLIGHGNDGIYQFDGRNFNRISDHIRPDMEAIINNINRTIPLNWDSQSEFARGTFKGTTATASGILTLPTSYFIAMTSTHTTETGAINPDPDSTLIISFGGSNSSFTAYTPITTQLMYGSTTPFSVVVGSNSGTDLISSTTYCFGNWDSPQTFTNVQFYVLVNGAGSLTWTLKNLRTNNIINNSQSIDSLGSFFLRNGLGSGGAGGLEFTYDDVISSNVVIKFETGNTFQIACSTLMSNISIRRSTNSNIVGQFFSEISTATNLSAWGNFNSVFNLNSGLLQYFYRTSNAASFISSAPFIPISAGSIIGSSVTQNFIQWMATMTAYNNTITPTVDNVVINYTQGGANDINPIGVAWKGNYLMAITTVASGGTSLIYKKSKYTSKNPLGFTVIEGIDVKSFWRSSDFLYAGASTSGIIYRLDYGTNFNGKPIPFVYETNEATLQKPFFDKELISYFLDYQRIADGTLTIGTKINGRSYSNYSLSVTGSGKYIKLLNYPNEFGNAFRFRFSNSQTDKPMQINHFGVIYKPDAKQTDNY